jgi:glycosyltransferase 2 family protein
MSRLGLLKLIASAALVWWLVSTVSIAPVIERLGEIQTLEVIAVVGLVIAQILMFAVRWWLVGRVCDAEIPLGAALHISFISMFFNQVLPATVGGDVVRVYYSVRLGVRFGRAVAGVLIDRVAGSLALVGLVALTLPVFYAMVPDPILRGSLTAVVACGVTGLVVLLAAGAQIAGILDRWRGARPLGRLTIELRHVFSRVDSIPVSALSIAIHLASVAIVILLARALGLWLDPLAALVLVPPVVLVMMIPISLAGWGVRETALVVVLANIGVAAPDALALSIAFGLAYVAASLPGGALWLFVGGHRDFNAVIMGEARRLST